MPKGGVTDQGLNELRDQLKEICDSINRRFEEEAENARVREAQTQELLVSTIIEQLRTAKE